MVYVYLNYFGIVGVFLFFVIEILFCFVFKWYGDFVGRMRRGMIGLEVFCVERRVIWNEFGCFVME